MAAANYIRAAASQLHQAVGDLQSQIQQIQHDADNHHRDLLNAAADHEKQKADLMAKQQIATTDPDQRRQLEVQIHEHSHHADQLRQQVNDHQSQVASLISGKQSAMNTLNSLASQLDSQAGSSMMN